jgi:hypothetical protein
VSRFSVESETAGMMRPAPGASGTGDTKGNQAGTPPVQFASSLLSGARCTGTAASLEHDRTGVAQTRAAGTRTVMAVPCAGRSGSRVDTRESTGADLALRGLRPAKTASGLRCPPRYLARLRPSGDYTRGTDMPGSLGRVESERPPVDGSADRRCPPSEKLREARAQRYQTLL